MANYELSAELMERLKEKFPGVEVAGEGMLQVPAGDLVPLMAELKNNPDYCFDYLTNLTAVDFKDHFMVIYNLVSLTRNHTLMVKVKVEDRENPAVPSLCPLWSGAAWQEREVYDLLGINFTGYPGHPTRILLDDSFQGHPLRKDFQWEGGREE
ncbi:NADH-quinone oxidoreductase subunit C [Desulfofundulus thermobenzoicus]